MKMQSPLELLGLDEITEDRVPHFQPRSFEQYLGQAVVKEKLKMYVQAARLREEPLDHLLLFGPPGLGKTTLAHVMAQELGVSLKVTSAPIIERTGDLVAMLSSLQEREIFFIDEIHRLPKVVEEILYSAMEQFCVDVIIGQGAGAKSIRLPIKPFTLIGATTKTSLISGPLQTRFGIVERLEFYQPEELAQIVMQNAAHVNLSMEYDAACAIGFRARGTPRIVKRLVRRVRDFAQVQGKEHVDQNLVREALDFLGIDSDGFNALDRLLLTHLVRDFDGGPVGIETLAAITGEDKETLEDVCEPFLLRNGFLQKTSRGRQIPPKQIAYLRKKLLGVDVLVQHQLTLDSNQSE